ncbi:MAG: hypothetical protein AB7F53_04845 [Nitrososphaeraceae archaeon]
MIIFGSFDNSSIAKTGTKSLMAIVPEGIVVFLGIKDGEKLELRWI